MLAAMLEGLDPVMALMMEEQLGPMFGSDQMVSEFMGGVGMWPGVSTGPIWGRFGGGLGGLWMWWGSIWGPRPKSQIWGQNRKKGCGQIRQVFFKMVIFSREWSF